MDRTLVDILIDLKNAIAVADTELAEELVNQALDMVS